MTEDSTAVAGMLDDYLTPLLGEIAWNVLPGMGSFIRMNFGSPSVQIGKVGVHRRTLLGLARLPMRQAKVIGTHHLWFYQCQWNLTVSGTPLSSNLLSERELVDVTTVLSGQRVLSVTLDPSGTSRFEFDLGCTLATRPTAPEDEQWMVYDERASSVLTFRGDGMVAVSSSASSVPEDWVKLEQPVTYCVDPATN